MTYQITFASGSKNFQFMTQTQKQIVKSSDSAATSMATSTMKVKDFLKSGFSTYFILDLLSFWNISLLFNFLDIESQPEFSKKFLWTLAQTFYNLGGLFQKVTETFKLPSETFNFQFKNIGEQMDEEKKVGQGEAFSCIQLHLTQG